MGKNALRGVAALVGAVFLLTGCMLVPGKFTSELELYRDGRFTYRYNGEIYLMAMSQLAEAGAMFGENGESEFIAQPCYVDSAEVEEAVAELSLFPGDPEEDEEAIDDDDDAPLLKERDCTEDELAEQREEYEQQQARKRKQAEQQAQVMDLFFGGLDPSDPASADELVKRLKRQRGWKNVEHLGDGKFNVEFELSGSMSHDFVFPTFERFPMNNFLLTAAVREPNTVRIDAPGFAVQGGEGPMGGMMSGMIGMMQIFGDEEDQDMAQAVPELDGTFAIITDGRILANNTDEGPSEVDGKQRIEWVVTPRTRTAPMALIGLD